MQHNSIPLTQNKKIKQRILHYSSGNPPEIGISTYLFLMTTLEILNKLGVFFRNKEPFPVLSSGTETVADYGKIETINKTIITKKCKDRCLIKKIPLRFC